MLSTPDPCVYAVYPVTSLTTIDEEAGRMTKLLVLDASQADPRWLLMDIDDADVLPAVLAGRGASTRFTDWPGVLAWVADQAGESVRMCPLAASAWRVETPRASEARDIAC
jgi:hypothetical protein